MKGGSAKWLMTGSVIDFPGQFSRSLISQLKLACYRTISGQQQVRATIVSYQVYVRILGC